MGFENIPFKLGRLQLDRPWVLAPLAGISDLPFRLIARRCGAGLVCSEMISAHGLVYGNRSTWDLLRTDPAERPVSFQLFGRDPEIMGEAAAILSQNPIDVIDINMGCPVRKVVSRGAGAALLTDLTAARAVVRAVVRRTSLPVTIKLRAGWDAGSIVAPRLARIAEDEGVSGLVIHGRTARQYFSGSVSFDYIRGVREATSITVIGNGDVTTREMAAQMMSETGCHAVMVGRGALGNPWIFSEPTNLATGWHRLGTILEHLALMERFLPPHEALFAARKHSGWYVKGVHGAAGFRRSLYEMKSPDEIRSRVRAFLSAEDSVRTEDSDNHPLPCSEESPGSLARIETPRD